MELWIRSQDKDGLYKVDEVYLDERDYGNDIFSFYIRTRGVLVARYETEERALEVLDEIQEILKPQITLTKVGDVIAETCDGTIYRHPDEYDIEEMSTVVYEMPKE